MLKLALEVMAVAPTVVTTIKATVAAVEAATSTTDKVRALVDGLEKVAAELKAAL